MSASTVRDYVVVLKNERVAPELRGRLRDQTKAAFGKVATEFARDIADKMGRGDLPGVIAVGKARSGALPVVFVRATESGAAVLGRDERVKAISAG